MMDSAIIVPALSGGAALLLAGAAVAVLQRGRSDRLRERVRAATGSTVRSLPETGPSIRVTAQDERRGVRRFIDLLGYNAELPVAYAASVPLVAACAFALGLLVFWRTEAVAGDLGAAAVAVAAALTRFLFRRKSHRYSAELFRQIPDAVSLVLRAVRAGLPVGEALRNVSREMPSPSRDEFSRVVGETALGVPLETALWNLFLRTYVRAYAFFAVTLGLHGQTGGNLAETLENLADMVRRRVAMVGKARALAAEARASAIILGGLPFVAAGLIFVISPDYIGELFTDPRGGGFLATFVVLLSSGLLTIRWLIQRSARD